MTALGGCLHCRLHRSFQNDAGRACRSALIQSPARAGRYQTQSPFMHGSFRFTSRVNMAAAQQSKIVCKSKLHSSAARHRAFAAVAASRPSDTPSETRPSNTYIAVRLLSHFELEPASRCSSCLLACSLAYWQWSFVAWLIECCTRWLLCHWETMCSSSHNCKRLATWLSILGLCIGVSGSASL